MKYIKRFSTQAEKNLFNLDPPPYPVVQYTDEGDRFDTEIPTLIYYSETEWNLLTTYETNFNSVPEGICLIYEYNNDDVIRAKYDNVSGKLSLPSNTVYEAETGKLKIGNNGSYNTETGKLTL